MKSSVTEDKFTIVGGGLAGCLLAWELDQLGCLVEIWDDSDPFSSSQVAAGVINPVSGMRLSKNWMMDAFLPVCHETYQNLATFFDQNFFFKFIWDCHKIGPRCRKNACAFWKSKTKTSFLFTPTVIDSFLRSDSCLSQVMMDNAKRMMANNGKLTQEDFCETARAVTKR